MTREWISAAVGIADAISGASKLASGEGSTGADIIRLAIKDLCARMNEDEEMAYAVIGEVLDRIDPEARRLLVARAIRELAERGFCAPEGTAS